MLKLKLQYFGYLMGRTDSWKEFWCWEKLKAGGEGDDRGCDGWMASPTRWTWVWASSGSWWWTRKPGAWQSTGLKSWTWLSDWTELRVKEENETAHLKFSILKTKITASSPITSWQIYWERMETVTDFIFLGSKITTDGDCSREIKSRLLLGRKLWQT